MSILPEHYQFINYASQALSTALPVTSCSLPSPRIGTGEVHELIPDRPSLQLKVTVTSELFHPASLESHKV